MSSVSPFTFPRRILNRLFAHIHTFWVHAHTTTRALILIGVGLSATGALLTALLLSWRISVELPVAGGVLREGVVGDVRFINPLLATLPAERDITSLVYAGLTKLTPEGTFEADLAESIVYDDANPRTLRVVLRSDARFHDGTPVTSEDVAFTLRLAQDPAASPFLAGRYSGIKVTIEDARTLSLTFPQATAHQAFDLLRLGILPRHVWQGVKREELALHPANTQPVGAGPYRLETVVRDGEGRAREVVLSAFRSGAHNPKIEQVHFFIYPTTDALFEALAKGDTVDATAALSPSLFRTLPQQLQETYKRLQRPTDRVFALFYNYNQEPLLKHTSVRKALDLLIDRAELVRSLFPEEAWPAEGPLPPSRYSTTTSQPWTQRYEQAAQLLRAAGWKQDEEGVWHASADAAEPVSLVIRTGTQAPLPDVAHFIARTWKKAGIPTKVETYDTGALATEVIRPRLFGVLLFGMVVGKEGDIYPFWHSSQRTDPGVNVAQYANIEVDAALEKLRSATSTQERAQLLEKIRSVLAEEVPASFLFTPLFSYFIAKDIRGVTLPPIISSPEERFTTLPSWYRETDLLWAPVAAFIGATSNQSLPSHQD